MYSTKLFVLFNIFILSLALVNAEIYGLKSQQEVHDSISVINVGDNDVRYLTYFSSLGDFYVSGVTANVDSTGQNADVTTSAFYFSSGTSSILNLPLSYYYSYATASVSPGTVNAQGSVAAWAPSAIIEYEENNGQAGFQLNSSDKVLGWIRLDLYGNFDIDSTDQTITATANGNSISTKVYTIDAVSPDGIFALRFVVSGAPVAIGEDVEITAEQSKADVVINDYYDSNVNQNSIGCDASEPFLSCRSTGPSSNTNSRLALASFFLAASFEVDANIDNDAVSVDAGDVEIGFNWVKTVSVNNGQGSANVVAETYASKDGNSFINAKFNGTYSGQLIVHSFDTVRPDTVTWDPTVGAGISSSSSAAVLKVSAFMLFGLVLTLFI
ncbi:putative transmembrane protein [Tieghemostelium lacteum]|uniref:Putative transmembrane protein n=1 Tax=Tieghemostelium lacteum TaxID=361077 RepID=A0A152A2M5_TIELA|nr:putative transmembrane protein [Tieghemostelium lacteum]|eukprot:KYR00488.1 putative transmembrane protein [Tieghemostelium lacteum]